MLLAQGAGLAEGVGAGSLELGGGDANASDHVWHLGQVVKAQVAQAAVPEVGGLGGARSVGGGGGARGGGEATLQVVDVVGGGWSSGDGGGVAVDGAAVGAKGESVALLCSVADGEEALGGGGQI